MKLYNLNFIEEPDWGRESSYDPRFLLIIGGLVALLLIATIEVFLSGSATALESKKLSVDIQVDKTRRDAAEFTRMQECTALWNDLTKKAEHKTIVRVPFSRLLSAWADATPGNVYYSSLAIRAKSVSVVTRVTDAKGKPKETKANQLSHEISCQVAASGADVDAAKNTLYQFAQAVLSSPFLAYWIVPDSVALDGSVETLTLTDGGIGAKGPFVAKLKPVDWYNETASK